MRTHTIQFVDSKSIISMTPTLDVFKFKPKGKTKWLQKQAWRFLHASGAIEQAYEQSVSVKRVTIDADKFMDRVLKQKHSLFDEFNKEGKRLLIGSDDYFELMNEVAVYEHFSFAAELGMGRRIMGLTVEVIPWMRGALVMP